MTRNALASALVLGFFLAGQGAAVSAQAAETGKTGKVKPKSAPTTWKKTDSKLDADEIFLQGAVFVETGELDKAEALAKEQIRTRPGTDGWHLLLGDVESMRKHNAEAFYQWQWELIRAEPGSYTSKLAAQRIQDIFANRRGPEIDEARKVIDAIMLTPKDPKGALAKLQAIRSDRGERFALKVFVAEALHGSKQYDDAARLYEQLVAEDPYFISGYVQLAAVYKLNGREADALRVMQTARERDSGNWRLQGLK